jgi:hypothetical protein
MFIAYPGVDGEAPGGITFFRSRLTKGKIGNPAMGSKFNDLSGLQTRHDPRRERRMLQPSALINAAWPPSRRIRFHKFFKLFCERL